MEKSQQNQTIYKVSDLIAVVNQTLDYAYPEIVIEGEVSEYKVSQNKWVYFNLKDSTGSVGCFMTIWQLRAPIADGMKVIISATLRLTNFGKFSLTVKTIRPSGVGSIKKSFEILKAKLDKEGLFSIERKRLLPRLPQNVAVISSTQSAGYSDFIKILNDRWGGIILSVAHVQVQGEAAPDQIIRAIKYFNQLKVLPEVVVIIRGGGSADDLAAFNDENLVRAIASSRVPTLVGVGHEIDESLSDLVADVIASTPSNAAQILVPDKNEIVRSTMHQVESLLPRMEGFISQLTDNVDRVLFDIAVNIHSKVEEAIGQTRGLQVILGQLDPMKILSRGYAIIRGEQEVGRIIEIETNKDIIKAEVKNVTIK